MKPIILIFKPNKHKEIKPNPNQTKTNIQFKFQNKPTRTQQLQPKKPLAH